MNIVIAEHVKDLLLTTNLTRAEADDIILTAASRVRRNSIQIILEHEEVKLLAAALEAKISWLKGGLAGDERIQQYILLYNKLGDFLK